MTTALNPCAYCGQGLHLQVLTYRSGNDITVIVGDGGSRYCDCNEFGAHVPCVLSPRVTA